VKLRITGDSGHLFNKPLSIKLTLPKIQMIEDAPETKLGRQSTRHQRGGG